MRKETVRKFKKLFEAQRERVLNDRAIRGDFSISSDDRYDEIDHASTDIEQSMQMQLLNRESLHLKKIDDALRRINAGTFGECRECEEDIELRRLEARPTASLCVLCKEGEERRAVLFAQGRDYKNLGLALSQKFA